MIELLAPAGSMEALYAAVQNGADAVYLGVGPFNARQGAKNFTTDSLREAVQYAHIRGTAVHLTLNTLVSDRESGQAADLIRAAAEANVDAFIVQDLGIIKMCREIAPQVALHGSTQMTVHSLEGVQLAASLGMTRVVLSRELSREEIKYICSNSPVEIEVFVHGALCMCYSGQCYMSGVIGRRSGNRGQCAQPCRLPYGYGKYENKHPLSLKDNCLITQLHDLEEMGVASIKLEGRMKRPEYVATVTGVYREALDTGRVTEDQMERLTAAFNRQGFTDGYYMGKTGREMFGIREESRPDKSFMARARASYEDGEHPWVPIHLFARVTRAGAQLTARDEDGNVAESQGPCPEVARNRELTAEELSTRLGKTGGTPFFCSDIHTEVEPGLSLSAAAVNAMRRSVLEQLIAARGRRNEPDLGKPKKPEMIKGQPDAPGLTVQISTVQQVTPLLLSMNLKMLYVPLHLLVHEKDVFFSVLKSTHVAAVLPRIIHDGERSRVISMLRTAKEMGVCHVLAGNLGQIPMAEGMDLAVCGDFGLNIYNSRSMEELRRLGLASATVSFEMTIPQIRDISKALPAEAIIYGRLPLMITENCLIKNRTGHCSCQQGPTRIRDRMGEEFPIVKDGDTCRSVILNGKKLYWLDRKTEWEHMGLYALRLMFTTENSQETDSVLRAWNNGTAFDPGSQTRGLYLRGVE